MGDTPPPSYNDVIGGAHPIIEHSGPPPPFTNTGLRRNSQSQADNPARTQQVNRITILADKVKNRVSRLETILDVASQSKRDVDLRYDELSNKVEQSKHLIVQLLHERFRAEKLRLYQATQTETQRLTEVKEKLNALVYTALTQSDSARVTAKTGNPHDLQEAEVRLSEIYKQIQSMIQQSTTCYSVCQGWEYRAFDGNAHSTDLDAIVGMLDLAEFVPAEPPLSRNQRLRSSQQRYASLQENSPDNAAQQSTARARTASPNPPASQSVAQQRTTTVSPVAQSHGGARRRAHSHPRSPSDASQQSHSASQPPPLHHYQQHSDVATLFDNLFESQVDRLSRANNPVSSTSVPEDRNISTTHSKRDQYPPPDGSCIVSEAAASASGNGSATGAAGSASGSNSGTSTSGSAVASGRQSQPPSDITSTDAASLPNRQTSTDASGCSSIPTSTSSPPLAAPVALRPTAPAAPADSIPRPLPPADILIPKYHLLYTFQTKTSQDKARCHPLSFVVTGQGTVVVADKYNAKLKVFSERGILITEIAHPRLKAPTAIELTLSGDYAVCDSDSKDIVIFSPTGQLLGESSRFSSASGLAVTHKGEFVICNASECSVHVLNYEGSTKMTIKHDNNETASSSLSRHEKEVRRAQRAKDYFQWPHYVCVGSNHEIIVSDRASDKVFIFSPEGEYLSRHSGFKDPYGCAIYKSGIIVADYSHHCIRLIEPHYLRVRTVLGTGYQLKFPTAVAYLADGRLLVSEYLSGLIKVFGTEEHVSAEILGTQDAGISDSNNTSGGSVLPANRAAEQSRTYEGDGFCRQQSDSVNIETML